MVDPLVENPDCEQASNDEGSRHALSRYPINLLVGIRRLTKALGDWIRPKPTRNYPEALGAYKKSPDFHAATQQRREKISELQLYELYRDYIKHEDALLSSRLSSFLAMNTFLIGASVIILGGIAQVLSKADISPERAAVLATFGAIINTLVAGFGSWSAGLTRISLMAATEALAILRDKGNYRLRSGITRGDLPYLTNARGLAESERKKLDKGTGIMRGIPGGMRWMWLALLVMPWPVVVAAVLGSSKCPGWRVQPEYLDSSSASYLKRALCAAPVKEQTSESP